MTVAPPQRMADPWICLMYHDVSAHEPAGANEFLSVSRAMFDRHLDCLVEGGVRGRSLEAVLAEPVSRTMAITFDDGTAGQYEQAFPALRERDMTATFFVTTSWVGTPGYVTWDHLREMKAHGMEIQSHTHTHPLLSLLDCRAVAREVEQAKQTLDEALQQDTTTLALPGGDPPPPACRHVVEEAGYRVVATSRWGVNRSGAGTTPAREVCRCTVRSDTDLAAFRRLMTRSPVWWWRRQLTYGSLGLVKVLLGRPRYARLRQSILQRTAADPSGGPRSG